MNIDLSMFVMKHTSHGHHAEFFFDAGAHALIAADSPPVLPDELRFVFFFVVSITKSLYTKYRTLARATCTRCKHFLF